MITEIVSFTFIVSVSTIFLQQKRRFAITDNNLFDDETKVLIVLLCDYHSAETDYFSPIGHVKNGADRLFPPFIGNEGDRICDWAQ